MDEIRNALTSDQAAEALGITPARVRQLVYEGKLTGIKRAEVWFFTPEAIEACKNRAKSKGGRPKKSA